LPEEATPAEVLTHLNLLNDGRPSHAAMLLFGKEPQRFLISSEVKCAHFHGTEVAKPIPSYQVYKGTVFALLDQAVDFVMSKINLRVGTRVAGPQAPVAYEIPREVVTEAIVNAVAHRDYASKGSVQVMLFADRLEVWNPGGLPPSLTLAMLRVAHGSVPGNPLLAEPLYLTKYIERMGTGTRDMIRRCQEVGLPGPEFSVNDGFVTTIRRTGTAVTQPGSQPESRPESVSRTGQVTGQVAGQVDPWVWRALSACEAAPLKSIEIQTAAGLRHRETFQRNYLDHLLREELLERTLPDKPNSRLQKYRLTGKGMAMLAALRKGTSAP
jgi:predicted HTH transcriptional regulator